LAWHWGRLNLDGFKRAEARRWLHRGVGAGGRKKGTPLRIRGLGHSSFLSRFGEVFAEFS
jgi:hypothetical protein